jgi:hypothetical protein
VCFPLIHRSHSISFTKAQGIPSTSFCTFALAPAPCLFRRSLLAAPVVRLLWGREPLWLHGLRALHGVHQPCGRAGASG